MYIVVGLGNPVDEYKNTRHNFGFVAIDTLLKEISVDKSDFKYSKKHQSDISTVIIDTVNGPEKLILVKPLSFMNLSGEPVKKVLKDYKVSPDQLIVIHDEIDLQIGTLK